MSIKRLVLSMRLLPLIFAWISTMAAAQQPREWPGNIEPLLFEYLSNLPGKTLPSLEVHCTEKTCLASFIPTGDESSELGKDELFPLHEKGWNVVSAGTAGTFDPATGAGKGFVHFSNDERVPGFPIPEGLPPPRVVRPIVSAAEPGGVSSQQMSSKEVFVYSTYLELDGMRFESIEQLRTYLLGQSDDFLAISLQDCIADARIEEVTRMMAEVFRQRRGGPPLTFMTTVRDPCR